MGLEKEQRRDEMRETAAKVFAEQGFDRTTIRGIAEAGGISAASIYYYFDSKEELLYQVLNEHMRHATVVVFTAMPLLEHPRKYRPGHVLITVTLDHLVDEVRRLCVIPTPGVE